jgi:hypothetical protein
MGTIKEHLYFNLLNRAIKPPAVCVPTNDGYDCPQRTQTAKKIARKGIFCDFRFGIYHALFVRTQTMGTIKEHLHFNLLNKVGKDFYIFI